MSTSLLFLYFILGMNEMSFPLVFFSHSSACRAAQTELMSHCEDVPAVRDVLQEDGLLLLQTLLEVSVLFLLYHSKLPANKIVIH